MHSATADSNGNGTPQTSAHLSACHLGYNIDCDIETREGCHPLRAGTAGVASSSSTKIHSRHVALPPQPPHDFTQTWGSALAFQSQQQRNARRMSEDTQSTRNNRAVELGSITILRVRRAADAGQMLIRPQSHVAATRSAKTA